MSVHAIAPAAVDGLPATSLRSDGAELEATFVPSAGMIGCSLRHRGEELLAQRGGLAAYIERGSTFGIPLLYPWANRLSGFDYEAAGQKVALDPDSPRLHRDPNGLPIHGLLAASRMWEPMTVAGYDDEARLSGRLRWSDDERLMAAFPYPHELSLGAVLRDDALTLTLTVFASGDSPVPVSFGFHPYLALPGVAREDWQVELPVRKRALVDEQMIPTGEGEPVDPGISGRLGDRTFDDGYLELDADPVFALAGGGRRIEVAFGEGYDYAQVYAPAGQDLICFEPMTAPTNALVSGTGLRLVEPGDRFSAEFAIRVLAD